MKQKWVLREEYKLVFQTSQKKRKSIERITPGDDLINGRDKLSTCSPCLRGAYTWRHARARQRIRATHE